MCYLQRIICVYVNCHALEIMCLCCLSTLERWNGSHTKPFFIEKGVRQGCILSQLLFCAYTEQVMREAEITESCTVIGGRSISNLRYADDTALCGKSPQEINNIVHKVNDAGRKRLLTLNARKTKLMNQNQNQKYLFGHFRPRRPLLRP